MKVANAKTRNNYGCADALDRAVATGDAEQHALHGLAESSPGDSLLVEDDEGPLNELPNWFGTGCSRRAPAATE